MSSAPNVRLRPVGPADEAFLEALYASTRHDELAVTGWPVEQIQAFLAQQFKAQSADWERNYPAMERFVVEVDATAAGRLYLDWREDELRIVDIALLPTYRGRGIGGKLLRGLLDQCRLQGKAARIHVEKQNPALRLYERLGFAPEKDVGVYWLLAWQPGTGAATGVS